MIPNAQPKNRADLSGLLNPRIAEALTLLREAHETARAVGRDAWEFAVEVGHLHEAGLTNADLRWLVCMGLAEHARERSRNSGTRRLFCRIANLAIPERTCFVLTARGLQTAAAQREIATIKGGPRGCRVDGPQRVRLAPHWDTVSRQLRWNSLVVKEFRLPAPNQEAILTALEKRGWPSRLDDPLPQSCDIEPRARLHDAIKALNRHQLHRLLSFRGDGTGEGILWEVRTTVLTASAELSQRFP